MPRDEPHLAGTRLPLRLTRIGALNTMVERVAQEMHDRITDLVDNGTVKLSLLTLDREVDVLAKFLRYITHHAWEAIEHSTDWNHADLHDNVLQIASDTIHLLESLHKVAQAMCLTNLLQTNFIDNELTHEVHKRIKFFDVNADTLALMLLLRGSCSRLRSLLLGRGCGGLCRRRRRRRRRRSLRLSDFVRIERLDENIFNFRNRIHGILHRLGITTRGNHHIKAALELLLLEILCRRNALNDITDLIECMHNHDGTRGLEHTGFHEGNLDMEHIHAGFFCLFHDIKVDIVEFKVHAFSAVTL